jgi:phenylacetate-CoA ligase
MVFMSAQQPQSTGGIVRSMLAATEKLSSEDLAAYQRSQLEQLLRFAQAQAPFYKNRLAPLFRKNGAIDWQRWQELPILTRADIKENGDAMMPKTLPAGHGPTYAKASSGTTGTPITVYCSNLMATAGTAAFERACRWYGHIRGDRMCIVLSEGQLKSASSKNWSIANVETDKLAGNNSSNRLAVSRNWPPARVLSFMEQHGSTCLSGNATTLEDLAEAQLEIRAKIRLKFMVGTSMALTERARELASQAFQARAFSAYTSKEAHKMAHECPVSGGFHVNGELVLLEILDTSGRSCGPGEMGRVIVTPLLGTAQPLIRYQHDDLATWGEPCACGRAHPLIARINGRVRNQFCFANGHPLAPAIGHEPYRDLLRADRWQVAQTGSLDIEVRYISSASDEAIDFTGLTQVFRRSFHNSLNVTYRRVETMPLTAAGKFMDYVNEYVV